MPRLENLDRTVHKNIRIDNELAFAACGSISMCAVGLREIPRLVVEYPIVFMKNQNGDGYVCVALFGCEPSENVFWQDGRWNSVMMPLNVGRQPFNVGVADNPFAGDGQKELVTCIDVENAAVQTERGERLFDENGVETPFLKHKYSMLAELIEDERRCREFTQHMSSLEMIRPFQLEMNAPGMQPRKITGLYTIDETKLRGLDAAALADLNSRGYLHPMYAMLSSIGQLQILARRGATYRAASKAAQA